jgi:hypothetical protein
MFGTKMKKVASDRKQLSIDLLNRLADLREKGIITKEEYDTLVRVVSVDYVESEVFNTVDKVLEDKIYPRLLSDILYA